jgi:hypothetical protein
MKKRKLACETPAGDSMATPSTARKVPKMDQRPTRADFWSILPDIPKGFTQDVYEEHISALQKENRLAKTKSGEDYGVDEIDIRSKAERYNEKNPTD